MKSLSSVLPILTLYLDKMVKISEDILRRIILKKFLLFFGSIFINLFIRIWWRGLSYMMTSSNGNIFRVTGPLWGETTGHRSILHTKPVTRSFDVLSDLRLNKQLSKQSWGWRFETPSSPLWRHCHVDTLRPGQDGRHFADDIFKCIFFNKDLSISIKISLKFVPNGPFNHIPPLVQMMSWRRPGDKPVSEPSMAYVTDAYMCHSVSMN